MTMSINYSLRHCPHLRANAIENVSNTLNHVYLFLNHFIDK
jgi:hypothetical protein